MPTFPTPSPIDVAINLQVGRIDVVASDRSDTVVTVAPSNSKTSDRAIDDTKISFAGGRLSVIGPKPKISWIGPSSGDSVDITVEVPSGSRLTAEIAVGNLRTTGRLGATRIKSATGSVDVDWAADVWLRASHGGAAVGRADGGIDITAAYGQIRVDTVVGDAVLKSSYGGVHVGESGGDLEAKLSYGDLTIARALGSVSAKTAFGNASIDEVSSGSIELDSGFGQVTVGVRAGVAAWLDLFSKSGRIRNELEDEGAPAASEQIVDVRARTSSGDITITRAR
ncbi:MAG TPA: DUF4097 family beta strand repeat-containing protein [Galbitalea sp.]